MDNIDPGTDTDWRNAAHRPVDDRCHRRCDLGFYGATNSSSSHNCNAVKVILILSLLHNKILQRETIRETETNTTWFWVNCLDGKNAKV